MAEPLSVFHFSDCPLLTGVGECRCAVAYREYLPELPAWDDEDKAPPDPPARPIVTLRPREEWL